MLRTIGRALAALWRGWSRLAHKVGNLQARILLTVVYALVVLPFGVLVRSFSDPLHIRKRPTQWLEHPDEAHDLEWAQRQ